jgi:hypothetical protein
MLIYGFIIALGISSAPAPHPSQAAAPSGRDVVAEVASLQFHSAFWPNLHHTLYVAAWDRRASGRRLAGTFPEPLTGDLTPDERAAWEAAVAYYDRELASLDLLFSNRLAGSVRRAMIEAGGTPGGNLEAAHREALGAAAPVYRKYWWPIHDRANRAWIADVAPLTKEIAKEVTARLASLYQTPWFTEPVRVDIVRAGNWQGAYTLNRPTHVTIASGDSDASGWNGVDVVFHEVSHTLILRIQHLIEAEARAAGKQPGTLWHALQFVMTGEVVREALAARKVDFTSYVYRTGLIDRAWGTFRQPLEREWMPYIQGKISLEEAIKRLVAAVP